MPQFFSVQMTVQNTPKVQVEQSVSSSQDTAAKGSKNSFNSILQNILPKETNNKTLSSSTTSSTNDSSDANGTTDITKLTDVSKASEEIAQTLLLSEDQELKTQISALLAFFNIGSPNQAGPDTESNETAPAAQAGTVGDIVTKDELIELLDKFSQIAIPSERTSEKDSKLINLTTDQFSPPDALTGQAVLTESRPILPGAENLSDKDFFAKQGLKQSNTQINVSVFAQQENDSAILTAKAQTVFTPTENDLTAAQNNLTPVTVKSSLVNSAQGLDSNVVRNTPATITTTQEAFLKRVQNILNNSTETGTLSIKTAPQQNNGVLLRTSFTGIPIEQVVQDTLPVTATVTTSQSNSLTSLQEGVFGSTLTPRQTSLNGVRHDSTQHFYDTKVQPENVLKGAENIADTKQDNEMSQPGSGFSQLGPNTPATEGNSTFNIPGNTVVSPTTGQLTDASKITMLPSGTVVQDQEVLQQLVERFQMNRRQVDTKIQLKLHPAELGEMKIDLTVKEGSIRANVVAQSQHVQQILERNLIRLKSVLEQQGFNVEEITVTTASDMIDSSDFFDQQLPNRESLDFLSQSKKSEAQTPFILDAFQENEIDSASGVNVKV